MKIAGAIALAALAISPVLAHHSFSTEYDRSKPISVTGVVRKVEWKNPHIWFYVDVKDAGGRVTTWGFSGAPPSFLMRQGIPRDAMKVGDMVTVTGSRAKNAEHVCNASTVTLANGKKLFAGSSGDEQPASQGGLAPN